MTFRLGSCPSVKDSGVEWLGEVAAHWRVLPGRVCFRAGEQLNVGLQERTVLSLSYGRIVVKPPERLHGLVPSSFETYQIVNPLDIVIRPTDLQNDRNSLRFGLSRHRGIITSAYLCFSTSNEVTPEYGFLLLHSYDLMKVFYGLGSGLRQNLDWTDFKYLSCCVPPRSEQTSIVRFLNHADRRIRRYIRAKQKLIALLDEEKQALIHQAVTGQIDIRTGQPYSAYKPSQVDWLGDVPAHWEIRAFTRSAVEVADYRGATPTKAESGVFLVTAKNIKRGWIDYNASREFVADDEYAVIMRRGLPRFGDLLLTTEAPLGHAALVDREDIALAQRVIRFRLASRVLLSEFALRSVLVPYFQHQLLCRGTGSTALGIKASKLPQLKIACPPVDEQQAIVAHIAHCSSPIDLHQTSVSREIELLCEYRTRLIADVVTGKLDVREAAAKLPDVDPLSREHLDDTVHAIAASNLDVDEAAQEVSP